MWKKLAVAQHRRVMTDTCPRFIARVRTGTMEIRDSRFEILSSPRESRCVDVQDPRSRSWRTQGAASSRLRWNSSQSARITDCKGRRKKEKGRKGNAQTFLILPFYFILPHATI